MLLDATSGCSTRSARARARQHVRYRRAWMSVKRLVNMQETDLEEEHQQHQAQVSKAQRCVGETSSARFAARYEPLWPTNAKFVVVRLCVCVSKREPPPLRDNL